MTPLPPPPDPAPLGPSSPSDFDGAEPDEAKPSANRTRLHDRRAFLGLAGVGLLGAGGFAALAKRGGSSTSPDPLGRSATSGAPAMQPAVAGAADLSTRNLIVIELRGGNDGLATLAPLDNAVLHDRRGRLVENTGEFVPFGDGLGLHPGLGPLAERGLAAIAGIGTPEPDGSHFAMEQRWWAGDPTGDLRPRTGFLGRVCDQLDDDRAPITGVSLGGPSRALLADKAVAVGMSDPYGSWFIAQEDSWFGNLRSGLGDLSQADDPSRPLLSVAGTGIDDALAFAELLAPLAADDEDTEDSAFPGSDIGGQLAIASQLIKVDSGIRVFIAEHGGYDTHDDQPGGHDFLIGELGEALVALVDDLAEADRLESTLIVTTSEFGRRLEPNGGGTDHGTASVALAAGPVRPGMHGEMPSLSDLDDDDNLVATVSMDQYYRTIAEQWFGLDPAEVLTDPGSALDLIA